MPIFIELHNTKGNRVFVNVDKIEMFYPSATASGSIIFINGEDNYVTESAEEILKKLLILNVEEQKNV